MSRVPLGAFCALVVATIAAFFVTQHLKVTTPVLNGFPAPYPVAFSPGQTGCHGLYRRTQLSFYLQHRADDVSVYVIDASATIVRTIASGQHMRTGVRKPVFSWDGREDDGSLAPDGTYRFRVSLIHQGRTIVISPAIVLKTVAPHPVVTSVTPALLPAGPGAHITYAGNEQRDATVRIYRTDLRGGPRLVKSFITSASPATWDGKINRRPAPAGVYLVGLEVTDNACNTGHFPQLIPPTPGSTPHAGVTIRYLAAEPPLDPVPAGSRTLVLVDSRQRPYRWELRRAGTSRVLASGAGTRYRLAVPVPRGGAGLYELSLLSGAHRTAVPIVARASATRRGGIVVVLPALSWQGQNEADDDGDGIPDTLDAGGPIQLSRVLAQGLPQGFADEAGLLAYLDRARLPYDLTTDIGLLDGSAPRLAGRSGAVLAGAERWLPASLAGALRSYVQGGGRALSLGIDSLRRGVTVEIARQGERAINPSGPAASDAFGARLGPSVVATTGAVLVIRDDLNIFSGTSLAFPGFSSYQPVAPPASSVAQVSAAGTTNASASIIGYKLGRGIVVEIGLPGFGSQLARSVDAQQLTRSLWTVLAH